ncbi:MAG: hypothetical protein H6767_08295 [Candidatus Peribacteria bacterium]|nr:MAG: hypothetical protein H6767_08295 [Candidatus Peribacteria bacterium]
MKQFVLTTIAGVESIAKKEIEKQGGEIIEVKDRMILFSGDDTTMVRVNLWSRVANKVYLLAGRKDKVLNFDDYYNFLLTLDWKSLIPKDFSIYVKAKSIRSHLESENSLQKIAKKAVVDTIAGK